MKKVERFICKHDHEHATERAVVVCEFVHMMKPLGDRLPYPWAKYKSMRGLNKHEVIDWLANGLVDEGYSAAMAAYGLVQAAKFLEQNNRTLWPPEKRRARLKLIDADADTGRDSRPSKPDR